MFDMVFHCLDHDNGVIDYESNRKHKAKKRQSIDGEAQHGENSKGSDQGNRHGE